MLTKTVRSRFPHEAGEKVEGCVILEKRVVIPPNPVERRLGVYDYLVEVPPVVEKPRATREKTHGVRESKSSNAGGTRSTPEMRGTVIRRVSSR
jgi:hypothetical protein